MSWGCFGEVLLFGAGCFIGITQSRLSGARTELQTLLWEFESSIGYVEIQSLPVEWTKFYWNDCCGVLEQPVKESTKDW